MTSRENPLYLQNMHSFAFKFISKNKKFLDLFFLQVTSQAVRTKVSTSSGAVLPKPTIPRFGITAVCIFTTPFIYFGAIISKLGAEYLEENDIFVPDDDDDDWSKRFIFWYSWL